MPYGDETGHQQFEGIRQFHTSENGQTLLPGALVTPTDKVGLYNDSDEFPDRGMVVECPDRPAGATFNEDRKRYESINGVTHGRTPAVGVIDIEHISEDVFEEIGQLCEEHVYPAVPQMVHNNYDSALVEFTGASAVRQEDHIQHALFVGDDPLSESWWPADENQ